VGGSIECNFPTSDLLYFIRKDINITKKNTEGMLVARKEVGMNVNVDRTHFKHMLMFLQPLSGAKS